MGLWWLAVAGIALFGTVFAGTGLLIERGAWKLRDGGTRARVEVVAHHPRRVDGSTLYATEFEVVSGPHKGMRHVGSSASNPPQGRIGERSMGLVDPESGRVASITANVSNLRFAMMFSSIGIGILFGALLFAWRASRI